MKIYANVDRFQFIMDFSIEHGFNTLSIRERVFASGWLTYCLNKEQAECSAEKYSVFNLIFNFNGGFRHLTDTTKCKWYDQFTADYDEFIFNHSGLVHYIKTNVDTLKEDGNHEIYRNQLTEGAWDLLGKVKNRSYKSFIARLYVIGVASYKHKTSALNHIDVLDFMSGDANVTRNMNAITEFFKILNISATYSKKLKRFNFGNELQLPIPATRKNNYDDVIIVNDPNIKQLAEETKHLTEEVKQIIQTDLEDDLDLSGSSSHSNNIDESYLMEIDIYDDTQLTIEKWQQYWNEHTANYNPTPFKIGEAGKKEFAAIAKAISDFYEKNKDARMLVEGNGYLEGNNWQERKNSAKIMIKRAQNKIISCLNKIAQVDMDVYKRVTIALSGNKLLKYETGL